MSGGGLVGTLTSIVSALLFGTGHDSNPHLPDPDPEDEDYDPELDPWANPAFVHEFGLKRLILSHNSIHGAIPYSLRRLSQLEYFRWGRLLA